MIGSTDPAILEALRYRRNRETARVDSQDKDRVESAADFLFTTAAAVKNTALKSLFQDLANKLITHSDTLARSEGPVPSGPDASAQPPQAFPGEEMDYGGGNAGGY